MAYNEHIYVNTMLLFEGCNGDTQLAEKKLGRALTEDEKKYWKSAIKQKEFSDKMAAKGIAVSYTVPSNGY